MSTAHRIPYDIFCLFAEAGGLKLALSFAQTCKSVKRRLDERYHVKKLVKLTTFLNPTWGYSRRWGVFGKFTNVSVSDMEELRHLPDCVSRLRINGDFSDVQLSKVPFPPHLQELVISAVFDDPTSAIVIPEGLKNLVFLDHFQDLASNLRLPSSLDKLIFAKFGVDRPWELQLPPNLKTLAFVDMDQPVDRLRLPPKLEVLAFGRSFNQPVNNLRLPEALMVLKFGDSFNQHVGELKLPKRLQTLEFGKRFNGRLPTLPHGLRRLRFGEEFNRAFQIPPDLCLLQLGEEFQRQVVNIPRSLSLVFCSNYHKTLCAKLVSLGFRYSPTKSQGLVRFERSV